MELPGILFQRQIQYNHYIPLQLILYHGRQLMNQMNELFGYNIVRYIEVYQLNNNRYGNQLRLYDNHWVLIELVDHNETMWYFHVRFIDEIRNNTYNILNNSFVNNEFILGGERGISVYVNLVEHNGTNIQY